MNKYTLTILAFFLLISNGWAQATLTAKVLDEDKNPISIGNIIILSSKDSSFVFGDVFYDGDIQLSHDNLSGNIFKIESLGFEDHYTQIAEKNTDFGTIIMTPSSFALEEVTVNAKTNPLFSQKNGATIVNVENSALSSMGTVVDILKSSPGILVSGSDEISMFGKGAVRIFIDGEEISTPEILKSLTSEQIKSVEIIRNPSAKYDASGKGGVINIITKNAGLEGLLGQLILNTTKATYQRGYIQGNVSYKKGPISIFSSLDWNPYKVYTNENYYRIITTDNYTSILDNKIDQDDLALLNNSYSLKVGYKLTDKHKISAEIKGRVRKNNNERVNTNKITINNTEDNTLQSDSELHRTMDFQIMNLTYSYIDTLGKFLKISGTTTNFDFNNEDFVDEKYLTTNEILKRKSQGNNGINIYLGKIDYEQPLLNDFVKFETGVKYATSKNKSETDYFIQQQDQWIGNPQYKSGFDYRETNSAAYVNFKKEINKLNLRAGLRYESNRSTASSVNSGAFLDTVYNNFFPSLGAEYKFTDEITLDLALTNRIKRPNFQDLDPYVIYLDSFSLIKGSPDLRPEIVTGVETNLSYSGYPLLTIGYSKTTNPIYILVESDETNPLVNIGISRNLNYEHVFNMQIVLPYQNNWWTSANGFGYNRKKLQFSKFNNGLPFLKKEYFVFSYQDFNIKGWNFGAQYVWFSPGIEGIFEYESGSELNAWVGKKFFDGKLKIRLLFNDILKSSIVTSKSQIGNIFFQQRGYYDSRRARIVFTYKFGKLKTSQKDNNSSSSEFDRIKLD